MADTAFSANTRNRPMPVPSLHGPSERRRHTANPAGCTRSVSEAVDLARQRLDAEDVVKDHAIFLPPFQEGQ
jgi:hypothetical protein